MEETSSATMKAAVGKDYGEIRDMVEVVDDQPRPGTPREGYLVVKVLACALAPGDNRVLSGRTKMVQGPPAFPYVIGGDVCGVVHEVGENVEGFKPGDCVVARFFTAGPRGGLAEYYEVKATLTEHKPKTLTPVEAASLASSGTSAYIAVENTIKEGQSVLVLGGGGGVGTMLVQLAKRKKPSFLAVTTAAPKVVQDLGVADHVINYEQENWWEVAEITDQAPFDVIIDLGQGVSAWKVARKYNLLKSRGQFLTFVGDHHVLWAQGIFQIFQSMGPPLWRSAWTPCIPGVPTFRWQLDGLPDKREPLTNLFKLVDEGGLRVVLSNGSPFPFTTDGVQSAMEQLATRKAHGKVVVKVAEE
ncbi:2-methylene-furan-3-one reductase [Hondaea fermentalgiana]|uniref:2-methylene-furan-3-one reductase n=1 Tax=Hondaea fermentalgiana TaxID=2315210 RepID=A0A2R5H1R1_9STRA|nr:2-methylene-furan-3-one reductase [Hondaea fermentalgiana]|eukprot:GBG35023.1 2-methylene-furan-3-one reductase [Hondaea fermentalgiana]